jgi:hypothetical protein
MKLLLYRMAGALAAVVLLISAFLLASLILAVVAVVGVLAWGWLWWRTRHVRRRAGTAGRGAVIEGEYRVEETDEASGKADQRTRKDVVQRPGDRL